MKRLGIGAFFWCFAGGLLVAFCSSAAAQYINEDPNALGPGQMWYRILFDPSSHFMEGQGWGYGNTWFYYPATGVYRQWFYRGPYDPHQNACMTISAGIESLDSSQSSWVQIRFVWTTPEWSALGESHPPRPEDVSHFAEESRCIAGSLMFSLAPSMFGSVEPVKNCIISGYSPEWVGIEVIGANVKVLRWVAPQCLDGTLLDFGDAPDSYGTRLASDGARHVVVPGVYLGHGVDVESDARPGDNADGDDNYGDQDEDGVAFVQPLSPGCKTTIEVTASTEGYLNAWFDFNHDANFKGSDEHVFADQLLSAGLNRLTFLIPATAAPGPTFARFRFNLSGGLSYIGLAADGEVEDYKVRLAGACGPQSDPCTVLLMDSFDDNTMGRQWYLDQPDADNVWLEEVDEHLEIRSKASATGARAQYVSSYWKIDAASDFSLMTSFRYTPVTDQRGWLFVRLSPSASANDANHVDFSVGCNGHSPFFDYEVVDASHALEQATTGRTADSGTLYISYDAALDELYLSPTAPGRAYAWKTVSGLLKGHWGGAPLSVLIGGGADGLALDAGQAWLDDFVVETGTLVGPTAVHRFWSAKNGLHFYTIRDSERNKLINTYPRNIWDCEGISYYAFQDGNEPGVSPVYRFWSPRNNAHFYTIKESEKDKLIANYSPSIWTYEGIAFYAYPPDRQPPGGTKPVYRFWGPRSGSHFYTMKESEKDKLITQYSSSVWSYEGIAWYAYE